MVALNVDVGVKAVSLDKLSLSSILVDVEVELNNIVLSEEVVGKECVLSASVALVSVLSNLICVSLVIE